jgi:parallel beta-helix repeat protein
MKKAILILSWLLLATSSKAQMITVDDDGPAHFNNIQAAIDAAKDGDTVIVADGTYTGYGNRDIDFKGKPITVRSTTGPENCIIDCQGLGRAFHFHSGEQADSHLGGFTITNGYVKVGGGGIYCDGSGPTLMNCTLIGNSAERSGGGLCGGNSTVINCTFIENSSKKYVGGALLGGSSSATFTNCVFQGNSAHNGGAIYGSSSTFINCIITGNTAYQDGGGIKCWGSTPTLINCTIAGNSAGRDGGGIYSGLSSSRPIITQCTIIDNSADGRGGGLYCDDSYSLIIGSILYGNSADEGNQISATRHSILRISYSNIQGGQSDVYPAYCTLNWGDGNIDADPCFIDPENGDYRLAASSCCIDAAAPYYYLFGQHFADIKGDCRLAGQSLDMGSNEFGSSPDRDADLLSDIDEIPYGSNPDNPDTDGDGLLDGVETIRGTDPTTADAPPGIFIPAQYPAIQQGLFLAFPLEKVTVSPGIYYENVDFQGKNLTLQSIAPLNNETVDATIIDGNGVDTVIAFSGTENSNCILKGFTVTNGAFSGIGSRNAARPLGRDKGCEAIIENNKIVNNFCYSRGGSRGGGGIFNCDGVIQNNIISNNQTSEAGGGIAGCEGTIRNNIISNNTSGYRGGGISRCSGLITGNIITGNYGGYGAGGIYCDRRYSPTITNCLIAGNITCGGNYGDGGGIYLKNHCDLTITNCTIVDNKAQGNDGKGGGIYCGYGTPTLTNCILWGNTGRRGRQLFITGRWANVTVSYSDVQGGAGAVHIEEGSLNWGEGNIDTDPYFVEPGYWDANGIWVDGDYRLWAGSPCIDAGMDAAVHTDIEGNVRPFDFPCVENNGELPDFDMGAYEVVATTQADLLISPRKINRNARGQKILAQLSLPEPIVKDDIDIYESLLLYPGSIEAGEQNIIPLGSGAQSNVKIHALFDTADLLAAMADNGDIEVTIIGRFKTGQYFYSTDTVTIK